FAAVQLKCRRAGREFSRASQANGNEAKQQGQPVNHGFWIAKAFGQGKEICSFQNRARQRQRFPFQSTHSAMKSILIASMLAASLNFCAADSSWPQFRGPNSSGVADREKPPIQFDAETNLLWKTETPSGLSSPCIAGNRIFLTGFEGGKLFALCFDRRN